MKKEKSCIMYVFTFIISLQLVLIFGYEVCTDTDINGPEPVVYHTSVNEPAKISLGCIGACRCREMPKKFTIFYGNTCKKFPSYIKVKVPVLKFRNTLVEIIYKDDMLLLGNLISLEIESNLHLVKLESGCFIKMNKLTNLSISFNEKLKYLEEKTFEGLVNLKQLYLRNNGFEKIIDISQALSPSFVPNLLMLVINRNPLKSMNQHDFLPMEGSLLEALNLILCQINYIHPDVLRPLKHLNALRIGENLFDVQSITNLIRKTTEHGIPLRTLNLYEVGFRISPPKELLEVIGQSNITYLNLGRNHFEHLNNESFPMMPNLEILVLRDVMAEDVGEQTFNGMTKLRCLVLNGNRLSSIPRGALLHTLVLLDLSSNSYTGDPSSYTHFNINDYIFKDMTNLQKLVLSYTQTEMLSPATFIGLRNLNVLELKNANLYFIHIGVFAPLKNLKKLNLENNYIGSDMSLTPEVFKGLENLKMLLLGGNHISNLTMHPSLFKYLPNLVHLGLERNGIHTISPNQFPPVRYLDTLDLSDNNLTPWNERLLKGVSIQYLNAGKNKLTSMTTAMMEDVKNVQGLILEGNPYTCDCRWIQVVTWLRTNKMVLKYLDPDLLVTTCVTPDNWRKISVVQYIRHLENNTHECDIIEHSNKTFFISLTTIFIVFFVCLAVIWYYYRWNIRYWIFLARKEIARRHKQFSLGAKTAISNYEYSYDAFVSYSNEDTHFIDKLVDVLENHDPFLKLCVYERDFQIGTVISASVLQNIAKSRRIILVVSDSFARSQWCRWEMQLAECHQLNEDSEDGLLLIRLEQVKKKNMTPFLKYIMKTRIYLEWEVDEIKESTFWDKLRSTLSAPRQAK